jgi:hypothetical protein
MPNKTSNTKCERNKQVRTYYRELRRVGYGRRIALQMVRERFHEKYNLGNITVSRLEDIATRPNHK